jgi:hypothetical protein
MRPGRPDPSPTCLGWTTRARWGISILLALALTGGLATPPAVAGILFGERPDSSLVWIGLRGRPLSPWEAQLIWSEPPGTDHLKVFRDGDLLDQFPGGLGTAYNDYGLWPLTTYTYTLKAFDDSGGLIASGDVPVLTPFQTSPYPTPFDPRSFWNMPVPSNPPIDRNSNSMVDTALVPYAAHANLADSNNWGIPVAYSSPLSEVYKVHCTGGCEDRVAFSIPRYAQPNLGSNAHLAVVDPTADQELDMWQAEYDPPTDTWSATARFVTDAEGWGAMCSIGQHCSGATASGFALLGGVIRPDEIAQGYIDHALVLMTPYTRADYIACPATGSDGIYHDGDALPEGAHIQLDPAFHVDAQAWPDWVKVVAHALQDYGAFVGDTGGTLAVRGEANLDRGYDAWSKAGVDDPTDLSLLPWDRMRVLQLVPC